MKYKNKDIINGKKSFFKQGKHLFIDASLLGKLCLNISIITDSYFIYVR